MAARIAFSINKAWHLNQMAAKVMHLSPSKKPTPSKALVFS
jgi:hypothetical protein